MLTRIMLACAVQAIRGVAALAVLVKNFDRLQARIAKWQSIGLTYLFAGQARVDTEYVYNQVCAIG